MQRIAEYGDSEHSSQAVEMGRMLISKSNAFALVTVLLCLVLLVVVAVTLLFLMQTERATSNHFSQGATSRHMAQTALELVQSQIRAATTEGILPNGEGTMAWASQPGMIRLFNTNGNFVKAYKLYSSENMTVSSADTSADIPANWHARTEEYVDLNEPVRLDGNRRIYPILNPEVPIASRPQGFSLGTAPGSSTNPAPMPVRWIYLREDGTYDTDATANPARPAVGRVAFWTDDESSKININTASASNSKSWWDIPRTASRPERLDFAERQPVAFEYQRYPGHPAMVNMTAALGGFTTPAQMQSWMNLTPRYTWGGSRNSSVVTSGSSAMPFAPLPIDKGRRLYYSVGELLFSDTLDLSQKRPFHNVVPVDTLYGADFFLTATSRAPDLNLFGQPRVVLWPVDADPKKRTLFDEYIALCGTVGRTPYYFLRQDHLSPATDINLPQNQRILAYLQNLFAKDLPGYSGSIQGKFGAAQTQQLLTSFFDYIRCANLNETYPAAITSSPKFESYTVNQERFEVYNTTEHYDFRGAGFVVPSESGNTRGMGRMPVISEAGLWIISVQNNAADVAGENLLQAALILETFSPMQGYMTWQPNYRIVMTQSSLRIKGDLDASWQNMFDSLPRIYESAFSPLNAPGISVGGTDGFGYLMFSNTLIGTPATGVSKIPAYQFITPNLNVTGSTVTIEGGVKLELRNPSNVVIQTYDFDFPAFTVARPAKFYPGSSVTVRPDRRHHWQARHIPQPAATVGRHTPLGSNIRHLNFFEQDVVRSVQTRHGDYRLVALKKDVPAADYAPIMPDYSNSALMRVHSFRWGWNQYARDARSGSYVPANYFDIYDQGFGVSTKPDVHPDISSLLPLYAGDFDNGLSYSVDGPFFNKPDEGARTHQGEPYYNTIWRRSEGLFCPSRQIPSAMMFGSIPRSTRPWETLLFCPNPAIGAAHPGFATATQPADWVVADFFNMPVTMPYAISEPFSTAGRVNLNTEIVPFTYINRTTGLHAVLSGVGLSAIPEAASEQYKKYDSQVQNNFDSRHEIDIPQTISGMVGKFYRSPTEICSLFLVPKGHTLAQTQNLAGGFWSDKKLTGDNTRERPYVAVYPLLTTKSNCFQIHFRAQAINQKSGKNVVTGEYRGSFLLERYIDPADQRLISGNPGFTDSDKQSLEKLYKFRVTDRRQFIPR